MVNVTQIYRSFW